MGSRICITGLHADTTVDSLDTVLAGAGGTSAIQMPCDAETGEFGGVAYVTMVSEEAARAAVAELHGALVNGCTLEVVAIPDPPAPEPSVSEAPPADGGLAAADSQPVDGGVAADTRPPPAEAEPSAEPPPVAEAAQP